MRNWKREHLGWTATTQADKARTLIRQFGSEMTTKEFQKLVAEFVASTKDWHVGTYFARTESSALHFDVREAEGRYFIVSIDRRKLSRIIFPFEVGDELVSLDGKLIGDLVNEFNLVGDKTGATFAAMSVTRRSAAYGDFDLNEGAASLVLRRRAEGFSKTYPHTLMWDYASEVVPYNEGFGLARANRSQSRNDEFEQLSQIFGRRLYMTQTSFAKSKDGDRVFGLGSKKGFLPDLGEVLWRADERNYYSAYIYRNTAGRRIGYVRIKSYMPFDPTASNAVEQWRKPYTDLEKIVSFFSEFTDGLVIDQMNNPGGDIFYGYFIASMLTDKLIETIPEQEPLSPQFALNAHNSLKALEEITSEEDVAKFVDDWMIGGLEFNLEHIAMFKMYYRNLLRDARAGKEFSDLQPVLGMRYINPHARVHYSKPVVVLANELSISAADYFPALVQDNELATIVGVKTSGAGGYVTGATIRNNLGVMGHWLTGSIAYRKSGNPIENLGVTPDVEHQLTVNDLSGRFDDFRAAINAVFDN